MSVIEALDTREFEMYQVLRAKENKDTFKLIRERAERENMKVNSEKTTPLCISKTRTARD